MTYAIVVTVGLLAVALISVAQRRGRPWVPIAPPREKFPVIAATISLLTLATTAILAITGFYPFAAAQDYLQGYPLLAHMIFGGMFIFLLPALALARADRFASSIISVPRRVYFWSFLFFGLLTGVTVLASMMPAFTPPGIHLLLELHAWVAALTVMALVGFLISR
jgi:hypothetical protein